MHGMYGLIIANFALLFLSSILALFQRRNPKDKENWSRLDTAEVVVLVIWWSLFVSMAVVGRIFGFFGWNWWQAIAIYLGSFIWGSVVFFVRWKRELFMYLIAITPFFFYFLLMFFAGLVD